MKISYNWLCSYLKTDLDVHKLSEILTSIGLEVEGIETSELSTNTLQGVVVGKVLSLEKHPNADKLRIANVDIGSDEILQIVCGAPNIEEQQKVAVATVGTELKDKGGKAFTIKQAKLRGVDSRGMICSESELGISDHREGIWVLKPSTKIGTPVSDLIKTKNTDAQIEIGLTPNRADAMSHFGVARDLYAELQILKIKSELMTPEWSEFDQLDKTSDVSPIKILVNEPDLVPRYAGIYLKNIHIKPSTDWVQQRLKTIGLQPINNVVDITNYILHDLGQPLHAFDADKISGQTIIVGTLPKKSSFKTLDGQERSLNGSEIMICDTEKGLCMAGIYGGYHSGVTEATKSIFLESAYFDAVAIRKAAKFHGLNTDASFRFERGTDPNMVISALKKAVLLLCEYADAEVVGEIQDLYPKKCKGFDIVLRYHKIDQLLGERIHRQTIKNILELLEIQIHSETNETLEVLVPPYRVDVQREVDLIEEILRIYGYNQIKIPSKVSFSSVKNEFANPQKWENAIANYLIAQGFHEAMNNSLVKSDDVEILNWEEKNLVPILNPLSKDLAIMRQSMLPGLLQNAAYNINRKSTSIRLFEIGKTYTKTSDGYSENYRLAILLSGNLDNQNWTNSQQKFDFFYLKGIIEQIFNRFKLSTLTQNPNNDKNFSDSISVELEGMVLGNIGIIQKSLREKFDVYQDVFYAELDWEKLTELGAKNKLQFREIPKFPLVKRDLSLLLDDTVSYEKLYQSTQNLQIKPLKSMQLFDVYEGEKLPKGKKSYALSFQLQNDEKTMSDSEIDEVMNELIRNFQTNFKAELRN